MSISILIPTYKRPSSVIRFANHAFGSCSGENCIEIIFGCHKEDIETQSAISELRSTETLKVECVIIPHHQDGKPHLVQFWNDIYPHARYDIIGFFGDDVLFKTPRWDNLVIQEFDKDPVQLVYGNDVHIQKGECATLFFTHKIVHQEFGYYLYPPFRRWYMDTFMDHVFRTANKINYLPELILEHIHPNKFQNIVDSVYLRMEHLKEIDKIVWESEKCSAEIARCVSLLNNLSVASSSKAFVK